MNRRFFSRRTTHHAAAASLAAAAAFFAGLSPAAQAIIVFRGDGRNLSPPTGDLAQSGWQYEGLWNGFTGTVIGPHQFLTATHVGGQVGALFEWNGEKYPAVGWTHISNSDMTIWWVDGTFSRWAALYDKPDEINKPLMLFGRGTTRGAAIRIDGHLRGWRWGETDNRLSWGKNRTAGIGELTSDSGNDFDGGGDWLGGGSAGKTNRSLGEMLVFGFVQNGDADTGNISSGDSGGGAFIKDGKTWKLAGICHGTDAGFRRTLPPHAGNEPFRASVFEARGLFRAVDNSLIGGWNSPDEKSVMNRCSLGFACRISSHKKEMDDALAHAPRSRRTRRFVAGAAGGTLLVAALFGLAITTLVKRGGRRRAH